MAPWAEQASNGSIHSHLKNVTRIGGTVEDIRAVVLARYSSTEPSSCLLAPDELASRCVEEEIRKISPVQRTAGNPTEYAVKLATYRDETTGFGWGRSHDQQTGYFEYVLATPSESRQALSALPLARAADACLPGPSLWRREPQPH